MKRKTRAGVSALFVIYLALLVWIILFKLQFSIHDLDYVKDFDYVRFINLVPFCYEKGVGAYFRLSEVVGNVLIFVPMGIYMQMLMPRGRSVTKVLPGFIVSILLESAQYILAIGRCDITDVITNTAGTVLGIVLFSLISRLLKSRPKAEKLFMVLAAAATVIMISFFSLYMWANR